MEAVPMGIYDWLDISVESESDLFWQLFGCAVDFIFAVEQMQVVEN